MPGAAGVLLEALRWRGRTARQIGLPTKLWCADFMNFVLRQRRRQRHAIARGALVPATTARNSTARASAPSPSSTARAPNNGHVGVVRGTDGQGNPIIVSGNHGNTVRQSVYPKSKVMAYVMPPHYVLEDMAAARAQGRAQVSLTRTRSKTRRRS